MCQIILVRPGRTNFDDQNRIQGSLELPLNEEGIREVAEIVDALRETEIDLILTSSIDPARTTAETLGLELGVPVKQYSGLENIKQGLWEGLEVDEVRRMYSKSYRQWVDSPESVCPPEGETVDSVRSRLTKTLKKPLKKKKCVAIVAPEPLATIVKQVVTKDDGELKYTRNNPETSQVEFLSREMSVDDSISTMISEE